MGRVNVRDGFWVLLAALWCVDEDNLLPLFLTAALVHEAGHAAALYLAGGRLRQLTLTACGAVMQAALPLRPFRLRGSQSGRADGWFCADDRGEGLRRMASCRCKRAAQSVQSAPPPPPLDGGMALAYLSGRRISRVRGGVLPRFSGATLLLCGLLCLRNDGGCWVLPHRHGNMYFSTSYEKMQRNMCILTGFCAAFCIVFSEKRRFCMA